MVRSMHMRDDGLPAISSTNIFSALESRRSKSSKKRSEKDSKATEEAQQQTIAPQVWTPAPVSVTSWADCEDDDDDYFALPALPPIVDQPAEITKSLQEDLSQESDVDEELADAEEENEEEEPETEVASEVVTVKAQSRVAAPVARRPDRQLSKKELKKKGLAELEAALAELEVDPKNWKDPIQVKESRQSTEAMADHANGKVQGPSEDMGNGSMVESKSSKRRKAKKEKPVKEEKNDDGAQESEIHTKDKARLEKGEESNTVVVDPREALKKIASMKKKKFFKESDGVAKAAAAEATARAARLAAAKKKEKSHYNQHPVR